VIKLKVYHLGSKSSEKDVQTIFVASDDSTGINNLEKIFAQITVYKHQNAIQILTPKDWKVKHDTAQENEL
jgi:hypothetical protein